MLIHVRGILSKVENVVETDKGRKQQIVFTIPKYDSMTGTKVNEDIFPAVILGDNIDRLDVETMSGEIVTAKCFLNSYKREHEGETYHNLSLSCVEMILGKDA